MPSQYIGLIVGTTTRRVYAVLNPDKDEDLDNPRHLLLQNEEKEPIRMEKIDRGAYEICMTPEEVDAVIHAYYIQKYFRPNDPPPGGEEYIEGAL